MALMHIPLGVDLPFAVILVLAIPLALTWFPFRTMVRGIIIHAVRGDYAASLDAALRLHRSWWPLALLNRWINSAGTRLTIAGRYLVLGEFDKTLEWCSQIRCPAHNYAYRARTLALRAMALSFTDRSRELDTTLATLDAWLRRHPVADCAADTTAVHCYLNAGRPADVVVALRSLLIDRQGKLSATDIRIVIGALLYLGRFDDVLRLAGQMSMEDPKPVRAQPAMWAPSSLGFDDERRAVRRVVEMDTHFKALTAAEVQGRWDLHRAVLAALSAIESPLCPVNHQTLAAQAGSFRIQARLHGHYAIAAAASGNEQELQQHIDQAQACLAACPRDMQMKVATVPLIARAWARIGNHERALAAIDSVPREAADPADRSWLFAIAADSLAALGRSAEAELKRNEAARLAPLAFWNRPSEQAIEQLRIPSVDLTVLNRVFALQAKPVPFDSPIPPVASSTAWAAWILALPALVPLLGAPFAIALLVLAIILLARHQPLAHDRRTGWAALALSLCSIAVAAVSVTNLMAAPAHRASGRATAQPLAAAASQPDTLPAAETLAVSAESEPESPPSPAPQRSSSAEPRPHVSVIIQILLLVVLIPSVILHEVGHGVAALWSGDPTARDLGRLTLNPRHHVSLVGSVIVPLVLLLIPGGTVIGWAKPVPFRYQRFHHQRQGLLSVSLAGVAMNLILAFLAADLLVVALCILRWLNPEAAVFDLLWPFSSPELLDVASPDAWAFLLNVLRLTIWVNVFLVGFNLLPIPPLDGFHFLRAILPAPAAVFLGRFSGLGIILLLALLASQGLAILLIPAVVAAMLLLRFAGFLGLGS